MYVYSLQTLVLFPGPVQLPIACSTVRRREAGQGPENKVAQPSTVFLAHQRLLAQILSHLPMNGKSNVQGQWCELNIEERKKLAVTED